MRIHEIQIEHTRIELIKGDIAQQEMDAIVTAANQRLAGGAGVDGIIHEAGGPSIREEIILKYPNGCSAGDAVITGAGRLKAKLLIHAVGPIYQPDRSEWSERMLRSTYRKCLQIAVEQGCRSIAFPSISTGAYCYPTIQAARVALQTVREFAAAGCQVDLVRWVLFNDAAFEAYVEAALEIFEDSGSS